MTIIEKWQPITPLEEAVEERLRGDLAAVDALHHSWMDFTSLLDRTDRITLRRRTLRKHAIETGIIERLYDIDWGLTETLVAEGLTRDAVARAGGDLPPGVLPMLEAQFQGLEMVTEYVRENHPLTTSFIKALHALITRAQTHYDATDSLGRPFQAKLDHGEYKVLPNNVQRSDGSVLEFAPPEQVVGEIERFVEMYNAMYGAHPVVSAAWLHHRFVQIHPFQDGNGRVARALTLLSLEREKYPPMVVDRRNRNRYLEALDQANDGDLIPLGRLFSKLVMRSIRRELEEPIPEPVPQTARAVARAFARSLDQRKREETERRELAVHIRARQIHGQIGAWFRNTLESVTDEFLEAGHKVQSWTDAADPDDPQRSKWWHSQIIRTARRAEHFAVMPANRWWTMLRLGVNGLQLRFVASIHHVGSLRTGIMAVTTFGDIRTQDEDPTGHMESFVDTSWDAFTFSHNEEVEDRAAELYDMLDQSLTVALNELMVRTIGSPSRSPVGADARPSPHEWTPTILTAIKSVTRDDGWAYLPDVGNRIKQLDPSFDAARYPQGKLSELIKSRPDLFETIEKPGGAGGPTHIYVKPR